MRIMKDAQAELYSLMGLNKSSSDISVVSNDSLNVSGIQNLLDSSTSSMPDENNDNNSAPPLFNGIVAFVDYKLDNDRSGIGIIQLLSQLGAIVEKTFNRKVTHVVFRDGYRKTYNKAIERKIPLVSATWVENSKIAKKVLNPIDYPPIGIEKYTQPREININIPKSSNKCHKFLRQSDVERDELLRIKCDKLLQEVSSLNKNSRYKIIEETENAKEMIITPKKLNTRSENSKEPDDPYRNTDIISIISDQLCKVLNTTNSPIPDEQANELYFPTSIKMLRKYLTPKGNENKTPIELDSDLVKIEDRLNLNLQARQRLRKLLFPSDKELLNMSVASDFPSPSPQKDRLSAPGRLTSVKKRKMQNRLLDKEDTPQNKNIITNEKTPQDKLVEQNILQWKIPSCLRPKITKKINVHKNTKKVTQETIPNMFSRNSSLIFQTPNNSVASPVTSQTIACTGMSKCEVQTVEQCLQNLGKFTFHPKVEPTTTYLITKTQPNRTLNMVFAMAFGCIIVSKDWVLESHKIGRWLAHEKYLITDLSEPVKEFQTRRQIFGSLLTFHIFDDAGSIYVSDACQPPAKQLKRLIRSCGGKCSSIETMADVIVGYTSRMNNNINEKWILDCITQGTLLNKSPYLITKHTV